MIRVISGKYRHRLLNWPKSKDIRPTMDKVREAIFSSLRMQLEGKIV
ncbi:16S rRNA (guanine(966)-N(2))-methyltransferase RsmD, partial [Escherichia coli]|nr:16S rRNA (guanine(966)-N(2))-methyltransferase RsmD [Escherichia coli]